MQLIIQPGVSSEGNFYDQEGILYADAIVVKFKDRVIDLPRGVRYASQNDISPNLPAVTQILNSFEQKFGSVTLVKQIPNAQWGDVTRLCENVKFKRRYTSEYYEIKFYSLRN